LKADTHVSPGVNFSLFILCGGLVKLELGVTQSNKKGESMKRIIYLLTIAMVFSGMHLSGAYVSFYPCGNLELQVSYGTKRQSYDIQGGRWDTWADWGVVGKKTLASGQWNTIAHPDLTIYSVKLHDMKGNVVADVIDWIQPYRGTGQDEKFYFVYTKDGKIVVEETSRSIFERPIEAYQRCQALSQ
jgi:hypothetical protein